MLKIVDETILTNKRKTRHDVVSEGTKRFPTGNVQLVTICHECKKTDISLSSHDPVYKSGIQRKRGPSCNIGILRLPQEENIFVCRPKRKE